MSKLPDVLTQLKNSKVALYGLGLTGMSMLRFLIENDIFPDVYDSREAPPNIARSNELLGQVYNHFGLLEESRFKDYDVVLISPGISIKEPVLQSAINSGVPVYCDIELFAQVNQKPVIAVTGSNGKSTVVAWLTDFINRLGKKAVVCGNYGIPVLDVINQDVDVFVIELSSFQLDTTNSLNAISASVLNVSPDHLDRYDSFADYAASKRKIYLNAELCLSNADDNETWPTGLTSSMTASNKTSRSEQFGVQRDGSDLAWAYQPKNQSLIHKGQTVADFSTFSLKGHHNAINALSVLALANSFYAPLGVDVTEHIDALGQFNGLTHRCQLVKEIDGIQYVDDSKATNIASCEAAIKGLAQSKNIVLIAGGDAKGAALIELKEAIEQNVKHLVAIGKDKHQFSDFVAANKLSLVESMTDAVAVARRFANTGDVILLSPACASIDMFSNYQARAAAFIAAVVSDE